MPTYDYECDACGHTFEFFQGINEAVLRKCPQCHKQKLRRLFGAGAAVVFKGSGFYQTDYRSDSYKKAAAADSKTSDSTSDAKTDSKSSSTGSSSSEGSKTDSKGSEPKSTPKKKDKPKSD